MKVIRINAEDTLPFRHKVLGMGLKTDDCKYTLDDEDQTFHLGVFIDNRLVSVASFYFENHPEILNQYQYRLRGMATLPQFQKQGYSQALLKTAFPIIKQNFCNLIWCSAREDAVGFYSKVGFENQGVTEDKEEAGTKALMIKQID